MNPRDTVKLDIPLFIRLLEYAKEDAKDDMDLHRIAENTINLALSGKTLTMKDYDLIVGSQEDIAEIKMLQIRAGIVK